MHNSKIITSLAPWISVQSSEQAVESSTAALGALETYRLQDPDGNAVVRLTVDGAIFWLSDSPVENKSLGGDNVRMILTTADPDSVFAKALKAGATEVFPVGEEYGWRLGRLIDPFGLHWEIGYELTT